MGQVEEMYTAYNNLCDKLCEVEENNKHLQAKVERQETALERLRQWAKAYPVRAFPEPDFIVARKVLAEYEISLDAVSASNMRHVIRQVSEILEQALKGE